MAHITFIHGIANKPDSEALLRIWLQALARNDGPDLGSEGISASMVYWADVMYAAPLIDDGRYESVTDDDFESIRQDGITPEQAEDWREELPPDEAAQIDALARHLGADEPDEEVDPVPIGTPETELERIPLPWAIKKPMMERLLRDVHHYLFNALHSPRPGVQFRVQDEIRARFVAAVEAGNTLAAGTPHVVVSHSMGTVIAYDCLKRVVSCPSVSALMTLGSPLGLDEIQDMLKPEWRRNDGFPTPRVRGRWVNVFDRLDPVAGFDPHFANDYLRDGTEAVEDIQEANWGAWRHSITKYLQGRQLRAALTQLLTP